MIADSISQILIAIETGVFNDCRRGARTLHAPGGVDPMKPCEPSSGTGPSSRDGR